MRFMCILYLCENILLQHCFIEKQILYVILTLDFFSFEQQNLLTCSIKHNFYKHLDLSASFCLYLYAYICPHFQSPNTIIMRFFIPTFSKITNVFSVFTIILRFAWNPRYINTLQMILSLGKMYQFQIILLYFYICSPCKKLMICSLQCTSITCMYTCQTCAYIHAKHAHMYIENSVYCVYMFILVVSVCCWDDLMQL
eukprot:TRINITY_DN12775_c2_g1_i2.p1 TRINITY_DN12775_c2_g1~~TRINITY_DN12775_c2_g1_i2.p1  ORF type:complete len:198 (-),score=-19.00 TRINITY_DN12775_c2_g1_i2:454-1047(-)